MGVRVEVSELPDERGLPIQLAEAVNMAFSSSIGRILSANDLWGSSVMREVILDEINGLRRGVLDFLRKEASGNSNQSRLLRTETVHKT